jgi:hypothetical protein
VVRDHNGRALATGAYFSLGFSRRFECLERCDRATITSDTSNRCRLAWGHPSGMGLARGGSERPGPKTNITAAVTNLIPALILGPKTVSSNPSAIAGKR